MKSVCLFLLMISGPGLLWAKEKAPATYAIPLPPSPDFSSLDWLVGTWVGQTTGRSPQGSLHLSVAYDLEKRVMVFREDLSLNATKAAPASEESWIGILSAGPSGSPSILQVYSSTGFVTRYRVTLDGPNINLNPAGGSEPPPGWLFRRLMQRTGEGEFIETVQVAPPSRPFFNYYTAKFTRVPPANSAEIESSH